MFAALFFSMACGGTDPCDQDGNGLRAKTLECGGRDCADDDPQIPQYAHEVAWDGIDQDCNGEDLHDYTDLELHASGKGCAIRSTGELACWGGNQPAVAAVPPGQFKDVDVAKDRACAVSVAGDLTCWGRDEFGVVSAAPSGSFTSVKLAADYACALGPDGKAVCWGANTERIDPMEDERLTWALIDLRNAAEEMMFIIESPDEPPR